MAQIKETTPLLVPSEKAEDTSENIRLRENLAFFHGQLGDRKFGTFKRRAQILQGLYFVCALLAAPVMIALATCSIVFGLAFDEAVMEIIPAWLLLSGLVYLVMLAYFSAEVAKMADVLEAIKKAEKLITGKPTTEQIMRATALIRALYHGAHWLLEGDAERGAVIF